MQIYLKTVYIFTYIYEFQITKKISKCSYFVNSIIKIKNYFINDDEDEEERFI